MSTLLFADRYLLLLKRYLESQLDLKVVIGYDAETRERPQIALAAEPREEHHPKIWTADIKVIYQSSTEQTDDREVVGRIANTLTDIEAYGDFIDGLEPIDRAGWNPQSFKLLPTGFIELEEGEIRECLLPLEVSNIVCV